MKSNASIRPYALSSTAFAIQHAPAAHRSALRALYRLHHKWREAAVFTDQHHAVTTLNWWHHEIEKAKVGEINHPDLLALKNYSVFNELQGLLHGHMHWHHLTRIDTLEQLQPMIDAIGGAYMHTWLGIIGQSNADLGLKAGRAVWWIDQTRHIGHSLTPSRMWLPMDWLRELNLPVHLLLNRKLPAAERFQHGEQLTQKLIQTAQNALNECQGLALPKSLNALLKTRALLLNELTAQPQDVWAGLVSISPRRKWWASLWA